MRKNSSIVCEHCSARAAMAASHTLCANFASEKGTSFMVSFYFIAAFLFQEGLPRFARS